MTQKERAYLKRQIIENDRQNIFDLSKDYFELDWYDVTKLDHYAELFGMKNGTVSRSRKLWYQITNVKLPF